MSVTYTEHDNIMIVFYWETRIQLGICVRYHCAIKLFRRDKTKIGIKRLVSFKIHLKTVFRTASFSPSSPSTQSFLHSNSITIAIVSPSSCSRANTMLITIYYYYYYFELDTVIIKLTPRLHGELVVCRYLRFKKFRRTWPRKNLQDDPVLFLCISNFRVIIYIYTYISLDTSPIKMIYQDTLLYPVFQIHIVPEKLHNPDRGIDGIAQQV